MRLPDKLTKERDQFIINYLKSHPDALNIEANKALKRQANLGHMKTDSTRITILRNTIRYDLERLRKEFRGDVSWRDSKSVGHLSITHSTERVLKHKEIEKRLVRVEPSYIPPPTDKLPPDLQKILDGLTVALKNTNISYFRFESGSGMKTKVKYRRTTEVEVEY